MVKLFPNDEKFLRSMAEGVAEDPDSVKTALMIDYQGHMYELIDEAIHQAGFPPEASHSDVSYQLKVSSKMTTDEWMEFYLESHNIERPEDFDQTGGWDIINWMIGHFDRFDFEFDFYDEPGEYYENINPTSEYLEARINELSDAEFMQDYEAMEGYQEVLKDVRDEEGIPEEFQPDEVQFDRSGVLAGMMAQAFIIKAKQHASVSEYLESAFWEDADAAGYTREWYIPVFNIDDIRAELAERELEAEGQERDEYYDRY